MHIISVTDFPLFCSNSAQKFLILPAELLASRIAYSAGNSAGRIYPSLQEMQLIFKLGTLRTSGLKLILLSSVTCSFRMHALLLFVSCVRALYVRIFQLRFCLTQRVFFCTLKKGYARNYETFVL